MKSQWTCSHGAKGEVDGGAGSPSMARTQEPAQHHSDHHPDTRG